MFDSPKSMAIVIDNFLNNPHETRQYALSLPYTTLGNYPGKRTLGHASASWIPFLEKHMPVNEKITWFDTHPFSYNGSFQQCTEADGNSWIHRDTTDWAAVLFLTPDAPIDSGLTLYRHKTTKALSNTCVGGSDAEKETGQTDAWEIDCTIGNVFNRLVLFRGSRFHKSSVYFGSTPESARLFQVHFFNTTSPPLRHWNLLKPRVAVIIMSTNRYDYLERTLASFKKRISFEDCWLADIIVIDDYPLRRDSERMEALLQKYGVTRVLEHETNQGLPKTWKHAWDLVRSETSYEWIFQVEDDVEFVKDICVNDLIHAYVNSPIPLTQLALKRQPCYEDDVDIMTQVQKGFHGDSYPQFVTQSRYFTTMAALYPRDIVMRIPVNMEPQEHTVAQFYAPKLIGALWGYRNETPHVRHIGEISRGIKGPGFEHLPVDTDYHFNTGTEITGRERTVYNSLLSS